MAVLVLGLLGSTLASTEAAAGATFFGLTAAQFGGVIGGTIGGLVDSAFIFPAIFGAPKTSGPRLNDLRVMTASEGTEVNYSLGPANRVNGQLIWATNLQEHSHELDSGKKGGGSTVYTYSVSLAVAWGEGEIDDIITIWGDSKVIYNKRADGTIKRADVKSVTNYMGTTTQSPDPVMQSYLGSNIPAFRNTAYTVLENLQLLNFGNRIPNLNALVQRGQSLEVRQVIVNLCERGGLDSSQVDASTVPGCIYGYTISGPQSMAASLSPVIAAFKVRVRETAGQLQFIPFGGEDHVSVVETDLAAGINTPDNDPLDETAPDPIVLPTRVTVTYNDVYNNNQKGSQTVGSISTNNLDGSPVTIGNYDNHLTLDCPFALTSAIATEIGNRSLWMPINEQVNVALSLPPSYVHVQECDVLVVPYQGSTYNIRVVRIDRGANYVTQVQGVIQSSGMIASGETLPGSGDNSGSPPNDLIVLPPYTTQLMDIPPLTEADVQRSGFYFGIGVTDPTTSFPGGALYSSIDGGTTFGSPSDAMGGAVIGITNGLLGDGPTGYWDEDSTVYVEMYSGSLASDTEANVLAGTNTLLVGSEILRFVNATLIAPNTWQLQKLLRGLRNTEQYVGTHVDGEPVVVLTSGTIGFETVDLSRIGLTDHYKGVLTNEAVADAPDLTLTFNDEILRPFSPCHVRGSRDGSNNLTVTWVRRDRSPARLFAPGGTPMSESSEQYSIDVVVTGTIVRTISTVSPSTTYSAADQTTDGITPGNPITVRVYQVSSRVGRGRKAEATI